MPAWPPPFHEDGVRLFRPRPLRFQCRCSRERTSATLASFPKDEVVDMMEDGRLTVTCEFCKAEYAYAEADLDALFEADTSGHQY